MKAVSLSWDELVALLDRRVDDPEVVAVVARAGNAVDIDPSSVELRPHGVWFALFRDTVRSVTWSPWKGAPPDGIPRTSGEAEVVLPLRRDAELRASFHRGKLARIDAVSRVAASRLKRLPTASLTWQQIAESLGLERCDPKVVALMLRSPRQLVLERDAIHLRQGAVLVMKKHRVVEARLHVERSGYSGLWTAAIPNVDEPRDGMSVTRGPRKVRTIAFRAASRRR